MVIEEGCSVSRSHSYCAAVKADTDSGSNTMNWEPITTLGTVLGSQAILTVNSGLGIVSATGKLKLLSSLSTDGSQTLACILNKGIDTTSGDVANTPVIIGQCGFPKGSLHYGGTDVDGTHFNVLGQAKSGVHIYIY
jgi:hypothetical protein